MYSVIRTENYVIEDAVRLLKIAVLKYSTDFILSLDFLETLMGIPLFKWEKFTNQMHYII